MTFDRFTKVILGFIAVALALLALNPWIAPPNLRSLRAVTGPRPVEAQADKAAGLKPQREVLVPRGWGQVIHSDDEGIAFEADDGTLRRLNIGGNLAVPYIIRRE